jgi:hypothetical protein
LLLGHHPQVEQVQEEVSSVDSRVKTTPTLGKWTNRIPWIIGIVYWMLMIINGRFHVWDFQVYYGAASDWLADGVVYGKSYGLSSGFFKYSLTALLPFVPLTFLTYFWASTLYYFTILFLITHFVQKWLKWLKHGDSHWSIQSVFWVTLIFFGDQLERELFLGNINFLLLVMLMWFWYQVQFEKWKWAGWILAFVCLIKPHFVLLLPLVVLLQQWMLLKHFGLALVALFIIPMFFCGPTDFLHLNQAWMETMTTHNAALYKSPNTLYGIFYPWASQWMKQPQMGYVLLVLCFMAIFILGLWYYGKRKGNVNLNLLYLLLFAMVPSLTHTDTEHFLLSIPLFLFLWMSIQKQEKIGWMYALMILALVPFLFNSPDFFGKNWTLMMDEGGLGWGNFILISLFFIRFLQGIRSNKAYIRLAS